MEPGHDQAVAADRIAEQLSRDDLGPVLALLEHEDEHIVHMATTVLTSNHLVDTFGDSEAFVAVMNALCDVLERGRRLANAQAMETIYNWAIVKPFDITTDQLQRVRARLEQAAKAATDKADKGFLEESLAFF